MTEPSVFINRDTVRNVPADRWSVVEFRGVRYRAYPISIGVATKVVTRESDFVLEPGFEGWIAIQEGGDPIALTKDEVRLIIADLDEIDPTLHWILNHAGDEWGQAGVIGVCARKWPEAFEHVVRHKVFVRPSSETNEANDGT